MNREEIISFIKKNGGTETAVLQKNCGISYKDAKEVIAELVATGELVRAGGLKYEYVGRKHLNHIKYESFLGSVGESPFDGCDDDGERRAYLEERSERIKKILEGRGDSADPEYEEDGEEKDGEEENYLYKSASPEPEEDETYYRALWLCIVDGSASISMLQRRLPIGFIKAGKIIDWMEDRGFISPSDGSYKRKVLLTGEDFKFLFPQYGYFEYAYGDRSDGDGKDDDFDEDLWYEEQHEKLYNKIANVERDFKAEKQRLVYAIDGICLKKSEPVSADSVPEHNLWEDEDEFTRTVLERFERLIKSDKNMGQRGAVKKAETYLEAVRDTHDGKMVQVYERLVYEIKNTGAYLYRQLKKQFFGD